MHTRTFSTPLSTLLAGAVLSLAATGAMAQTTPATNNPATVGVTPQEAAEANRKAVPRADTGTVVRTDESAAQKAREATDRAGDKASNMADRASNAVDNNTSANTTNRAAGTTTTNTTANPSTAADNNAAALMNDNGNNTTGNRNARRARADRN